MSRLDLWESQAMSRFAAITFALVMVMGTPLSAQAPARPGGSEADSYSIQDIGLVPRLLPKLGLLRMGPIQEELKLTDAQKEASESPKLFEPFQERMRAARGVEDREKRMAAMQV